MLWINEKFTPSPTNSRGKLFSRNILLSKELQMILSRYEIIVWLIMADLPVSIPFTKAIIPKAIEVSLTKYIGELCKVNAYIQRVLKQTGVFECMWYCFKIYIPRILSNA